MALKATSYRVVAISIRKPIFGTMIVESDQYSVMITILWVSWEVPGIRATRASGFSLTCILVMHVGL